LSEPGLWRGHDHVAKRRKFRATANRGAVHNAQNRLGSFQYAGENRMERIQHLEDPLRGVFADIDAAAENLAGRIDHDKFDVAAFAGKGNAVGKFPEHGFVQEIMFWPVQGHAGDAGLDAVIDKLEFFGPSAAWFGANLNGMTGWHGGFLPQEHLNRASNSMLARGEGRARLHSRRGAQ
jgi:hypothetical protein